NEMKVCHITSLHRFKDVSNTRKEAVSLNEKNNMEVFLIAPNTDNVVFNGIQVIGVDRKNRNRLSRIFNATKEFYFKAIELNADVYHFHDPELIPLGKKLAKGGKKVIYDVHEDVPRQILEKTWIPKQLRRIVSWIFDKYEKKSVKNFSAVITATPYITKMFGKSNNNIIDIKNYPILKELTIDEEHYNKKSQFVYVGGISINRGVTNMVKAIGNMKGSQLALEVKFTNDNLKEKSMQLNGWQQVDYVGFIDRDEVKQLLGESMAGLVVLHPTINYKDSLPIKMFEYMAAGIPVIASNFPLWKEIVEKNECGICVDPLNHTEILNAMKYIKNNPDIAKQMGRNGRHAVEAKYNWEA